MNNLHINPILPNFVMRSILAVIIKHQKNMEAEKIICCDGGRSNDALAYAAMANANRDDNAMNQWMNNPFAYIMFMAMFGNGGFGWGNRGNQLQDAEVCKHRCLNESKF